MSTGTTFEQAYGLDQPTGLVDKGTQAYEMIDGLRRGLIVRESGLKVLGFILPENWGDAEAYEGTFKAQMKANGDFTSFMLRSDKISTLGVVV